MSKHKKKPLSKKQSQSQVIGTLVFGKYDAAEVVCRDPGLAPYINLSTVGVPHTGGRHANAWFGKARLSVVEIHQQINAHWKVHW